ncbi:hypothetical protein LSAT2_029429 [Lamellibrachia satsuma]|nr:hypothetical protein LSAT2_029429 [Lamellibrachia satsuma]
MAACHNNRIKHHCYGDRKQTARIGTRHRFDLNITLRGARINFKAVQVEIVSDTNKCPRQKNIPHLHKKVNKIMNIHQI